MYEKRMEIYNKAHIIIELKEYKEENIDIIINSIKRNLEI